MKNFKNWEWDFKKDECRNGREDGKLEKGKNLVIYGLPGNNGREDKEIQMKDNEIIEKLTRELAVEVEKFTSIRLAKQIKVNSKPRPLKVEMGEEYDKSKIVKGAEGKKRIEVLQKTPLNDYFNYT